MKHALAFINFAAKESLFNINIFEILITPIKKLKKLKLLNVNTAIFIKIESLSGLKRYDNHAELTLI